MALKLLLDENLRDKSLWRAIQNHNATVEDVIDVVRVGDGDGPELGIQDLELLAWAARHERIVIGLDKNTLPRHLAEFCRSQGYSPGVIFLRCDLSNTDIVDSLFLICHVTASDEWANTYRWIP